MNYDVFNGDADGIIALLQLQLANPTASVKVTGVKRDISLLKQVTERSSEDKHEGDVDVIRVLDISMEKNKAALNELLAKGSKVTYIDHHRAGEIPEHDNLDAHIDLDANTCTALIVDKLLDGQFHEWAICAAFGDNLIAKATELAISAGLNDAERADLETLGTLINYNGYGSHIDDLHFHPSALLALLLAYSSPFDAIKDVDSPYYILQSLYNQDHVKAVNTTAFYDTHLLTAFELPDDTWARRISGVFGNELANISPDKAHAIFTINVDSTYTVSLRAPLSNKQGAGDICSQFATGGGRAAAAGVNALPKEQINDFLGAVEKYYR
ncbi:MAG: DHH family phosphoesterase [Alteromonadaceae bacterium]